MTLASSSADQTIRLWNIAERKEIRQLKGHAGAVYSVAYSFDGKQLVSGGVDKVLRLWNTEDGSEMKSFPGSEGPIYSVDFSPDGALLAAGGSDAKKTIRLWEIETGEVVRVFNGHTDDVYRVTFNNSGTRLLTCGYSGAVKIWDATTGLPLLEQKYPPVLYYAAYTPDGVRFAAAGYDRDKRVAKTYLLDVPQNAR